MVSISISASDSRGFLPVGPTAPASQASALPRPMTSFIGREHDIDAICGMLERTDVRLVTLTGPGGVGKTRLALIVASQTRVVFADGVAFVPLDAILDPSLVPAIVAEALGVPNAPGQSLSRRIRVFLSTRSLLLVLDNLEHLPDASSFVAELLDHSGQLKILGTSRTRLGISGEQVFPVSSLGADAAFELFEQRARSIEPDFSVTDEMTPVVEEICERLDGLPLAIELAAARVNVLPPTALLQRLEHRLSILTGGPRDAPARQHTMRAAIAWSYDLLAAGERALLRRLAVFVGGFTLRAAEAVMDDAADVLGGVSALIESSLVKRVKGPNEEPRFQVLETIREFALEELRASGEENAVRDRHATWFMSMTEAEIPNFDGQDLRDAHDRVEAELGNCRAALSWSLESGEAEIGIRLAGALWRVWWYGGATGRRPWIERVTEGRSWLDRTLAWRDGIPVAALAEAMAGSAQIARMLGDVDRGQELAEELLVRAQAEGHPYGIYWSHLVLGFLAEARGQVDGAKRLYEQACEVASAIRNPQNHRAMPLIQIGGLLEREGKLESAEEGFAEALVLYRECGNRHGLATATFNLGRNLRKQGVFGQAASLLKEGMTFYVSQRDQGGVHACLVELALLALQINRAEQGVRLLSTAEEFPGHPDYHPVRDQVVSMAQRGLGQSAYAAAWQEGQRQSWVETVAGLDALIAAAGDDRLPSTGSPRPSFGLSVREYEVLELLADGRSNRAIADTLSISERTVENHVRHILDKLDLDSRTAAATFAVRH